MMIERISLDQGTLAGPQPLFALNLVVSPHAPELLRQDAAIDAIKNRRSRVTKRQPDVATTHGEQFFDRSTALRRCGQQSGPCTKITANFLDRHVASGNRLRIVAPALHKKPMEKPHWLR